MIPLGDGNQIVFIKNENAYLELFQSREARPVPHALEDGPWYSEWRHLAFKVESVDEKLEEMGPDARITLGPFDFDGIYPRLAHGLGG